MIKKILLTVAISVSFLLPIDLKANIGAIAPIDTEVYYQDQHQFALTWGANNSVDGYEVWRSTTIGGNEFKKIKTINSSVTNIYNGKTPKKRAFRYKVRAFIKQGEKIFYGDFGQELILSTKNVEENTLIKYLKQNNGIYYHFYNTGQSNGYYFKVKPYDLTLFDVVYREFSAKNGFRYENIEAMTITLKRD